MAINVHRYWALLALAAAAATCYSFGFAIGFWLLIAAGLIFELAFWYQLLKSLRRR